MVVVVGDRWDAEMDDAVREHETSALIVERKGKGNGRKESK